jgi:hypothetical protein
MNMRLADADISAPLTNEGTNEMQTNISRCDVVEIPVAEGLNEARQVPRDILPWADPYITALLTKRRLQAALDDSLLFVRRQADIGLAPRDEEPRHVRRFTFPGS